MYFQFDLSKSKSQRQTISNVFSISGKNDYYNFPLQKLVGRKRFHSTQTNEIRRPSITKKKMQIVLRVEDNLCDMKSDVQLTNGTFLKFFLGRFYGNISSFT